MPAAKHFDATLGLGSNVGDKRANIARAISLLTEKGDIRLVERSRDYKSAPWGVKDQDWFVNACVSVATGLSARALLERCQQVESAMGRVRKQKWGPRVIDCDVLTYRDERIAEPGLNVPHPLIAERSFVLVPLKDVAPGLKLGGRSLDELISQIDTTDCVAITETDA